MTGVQTCALPICPVAVHPALRSASTIRPEILEGVDLVFVRELTGGIYFGAKTRTPELATDLCSYSVAEVERVTRVAARMAQQRQLMLDNRRDRRLDIDQRHTRLRDQLDACIGCGCLSLKHCKLYNPQDAAAARGPGARYLLGDRPPAPQEPPER